MEQTYNLFIEEYLAATIHTSWKIKELIIDLINTYNLIPEDTSTIKTLIINNLRKKSTDINISRVARNTANEILARRLRRSIIQQRNIDNEVQNQESTLDLISDSPPLDTSTDQPTPLEQQSSTEPPSIKIPYKVYDNDAENIVLRAYAESVEVIIENSTNVTIKGQLPFGNDYGNLIEANWLTDFELNIIFPSEIDESTLDLTSDPPSLDTSTDQLTPLKHQLKYYISFTVVLQVHAESVEESTLDLTSDPPSLDTPTDQLTPLEHQLKYHIRYTTMTLRTVVLRAHAESVEVIIENSTNVTIKGQLPFGNDYGNLIEANWPTDFELNIIFPSEINVNDDATVKLEDDSSILAINKKGKKKLNIPVVRIE
ncbi:hypothetical protein C2G38_2223247 [Gigaspora rosea]|uniref:Uncharacterized protein n=1 Tax=Gigaspora rosea TaxID=44941 RepID=A0A397U368_9GLOM|nr:hypothetical protein C2G38_2223247 [Gigaspora rosea]